MEYTQEELEKIVTDCGCQFLGIKEHFPEDGPLLYFNTPSGSTKTVKLRGKSLDEIKKNIEGKYGDLLFAEWLENHLKDNECGFFERQRP